MKVVVLKERSEGNEQVGDSWIETAIFQDSTPLKEVLLWASRGKVEGKEPFQRACKYGRLMLTVPDEIEKGEGDGPK